MCDANIALRHQLGAITAIVVSGQLFNERTNAQLEKILKKLQSYGLYIINGAQHRKRQEDLQDRPSNLEKD